MEIAVPAGSQLSLIEIDGTVDRSLPIDDSSGIAGCSGYDVDGDGAYEVLYADQTSFWIVDGPTGAVRFTSPAHNSGTLWEYPVTADVDGDGAAEIVVANNSGTSLGLTVFGHAAGEWAISGATWPTHDFAMTNVNGDGSVPTSPEAPWSVYNVFRARPQFDEPAGRDLAVSIADVCIADCVYGPVTVAVQVSNPGSRTVRAGAVVELYGDDTTGAVQLATLVLPEVPAGESLDGVTVDVDPALVGDRGFYVILDRGLGSKSATRTTTGTTGSTTSVSDGRPAGAAARARR